MVMPFFTFPKDFSDTQLAADALDGASAADNAKAAIDNPAKTFCRI
jgi:hypothetical protein